MMKRTKRTLIVAVALVSLICAGLAFARWGQGKQAMGDLPGQEARQRGFDRLIDKLGLTEEQAEELKTILDEHRETMKDLKSSLRDLYRAIREELGKDEPNEEELARLIAEVDAIREQMKAEQEAFKAKIDEFKADLTITQQAQFLLFEARMHGRMRGPGRHQKRAWDERPGEACPLLP